MKTPDEIKKGLIEPELFCDHCEYYGEPNGCNRPNGSCKAYDNADDAYKLIQQLEAQVPKWISVEERLPKHGRYLVITQKADGMAKVNTATYNDMGWWMYANFGDITHWMPLPEPPEVD